MTEREMVEAPGAWLFARVTGRHLTHLVSAGPYNVTAACGVTIDSNSITEIRHPSAKFCQACQRALEPLRWRLTFEVDCTASSAKDAEAIAEAIMDGGIAGENGSDGTFTVRVRRLRAPERSKPDGKENTA